MPLAACKSFHFFPFASEYSSHLSAASSSSSLWDYTLLHPIPPAMCYCHITATSESYSTRRSSCKSEIIRFSVWKTALLLQKWGFVCERSNTSPLPLRGEDVTHPTAQYGVSQWVNQCESKWSVWVYMKERGKGRGGHESSIWAVHCHLL